MLYYSYISNYIAMYYDLLLSPTMLCYLVIYHNVIYRSMFISCMYTY